MNNANDSQLVSPILASRTPLDTQQLLEKLDVSKIKTANACIQAAQVAIEVSALQKALALSIRAVELQPENQMLGTSLVTAYMFSKDNQGALASCNNYIRQFGKDPIILCLMGNAYSGLGQFDSAEAAFRQALSMDPKLTMAITGLYRCKKFKDEEAQTTLELFNTALQQQIQVEDRSSILFAIAKLHNDQAQYDLAWQKAAEANNLIDLKHPFKQKQTFPNYIDRLITHYQQNQTKSESQASPILIVGMPRSGTTLVEQIIGGHPSLYAGGETPSIEYSLALGAFGKNTLSKLTVSELNQCAKHYLNYFQQLHHKPSKEQRIINKLPINFLNVGFFKSLFPKGKVIHLKRDYRDIMASTHFEQIGGSVNYTNRSENVAFMYQQCMRLMRAWQSIYADILEINYEDLVADYEQQVSAISAYLNIDQTELGDFTQTDNSVETLSLWQVRQGLYQSSSGRYKRYAALAQLPKSIDDYPL